MFAHLFGLGRIRGRLDTGIGFGPAKSGLASSKLGSGVSTMFCLGSCDFGPVLHHVLPRLSQRQVGPAGEFAQVSAMLEQL